MSRRLSERIDPWMVAASEEHLQGLIALSEMKRLSAELVDVRGDVQVAIRGAGRVRGWYMLDGTAAADVDMVCQRCLGPVSIALRAEFTLALVEDERGAAELPEELEPLVARPYVSCRLADLIEDELLLELPVVPMHDAADACGHNGFPTDVESSKRRPFFDLGELWARAKKQE